MATRRNGRRDPINPDVTTEMGRTFLDLLQNLQIDGGGNGNRNRQATEQFRQYGPPTFNGRDGPAAIEEWFRAIERIFRMVECDDAQKIACATYQLIEDAGHWWESFSRNQSEVEKNGFTWDNFKATTMDKYFPQSYADQKEGEFLYLKQGNMTVTDYERKFNELSRFATHLVNTDERRSMRFVRGLRPKLGGILVAQGDLAYAELLKRAEKVEAILRIYEEGPKMTVTIGKRKRSEEDDDQNQTRMEKASKLMMGSGKFHCKKCGRYHHGECLLGKGKCFRCHLPGHKVKNCPLKHQVGKAPQEQGQGRGESNSGGYDRMYAIIQDKANRDLE